MTVKRRVDRLDSARGIGILLVIFGHVIAGLQGASVLSPDAAGWNKLYYLIYLFHMPLFFILSGFLSAKGLEGDKSAYIFRKAKLIIPAYFIWTFIQGLIQANLSTNLNNPPDLNRLLITVFYPYGHFWFLHALFLYHLVAAFLPRSLVGYVFSALIAYMISSKFGGYPHILLYHLPFFLIGVSVGSAFRTGEIDAGVKRYPGLIFLVTGVVYFTVANVNFAFESFDSQTPLALLAGFAGAGLTLAAGVYLSYLPFLDKVLRYIGGRSLPIYLLHILAASGIRVILSKLGLSDSTVHLLAGTVIGVAAPLLLYALYQQVKKGGFIQGNLAVLKELVSPPQGSFPSRR